MEVNRQYGLTDKIIVIQLGYGKMHGKATGAAGGPIVQNYPI